MSPIPSRIFRPIQGNGPVQDVTLIDLQCGGYTAGGSSGSSPANLTAGPVAAGSTVSLRWTLWPESHVGPVITYMARCANDNCATYVPGTRYFPHPLTKSIGSLTSVVPYGSRSKRRAGPGQPMSGEIHLS